MTQLVYFELRKNFLRKSVLTVLTVFFLFNIANIYTTYRFGLTDSDSVVTPYNITPACYQYYKTLHKKYDGMITRNNISEINNHYESLQVQVDEGTYSKEYDEKMETGYLFGDFYYLGKYIYNPMKYNAMYSTNIKIYMDKVKENKEFYKNVGNKAYEEKYRYLEKKYRNRKITSFFEVDNWKFLFDYKFSDLLILILILLGAIPLFESEKTTGMYDIIMSNYKGKKSYFIHKFISLQIYTITLVILFTLTNYLVINQLFDLEGPSRPLYCIPKYQFTTLNCNLFTFYILCSFLKLLGFLVISMLVGKLSQISKGIVLSYLGSSIFFVAGLYCSGFCISEMGTNKWLAVISPFTLLKGNLLYSQIQDFTIFEHYFTVGQFCFMTQILIFVCILGWSILKGMRKRQVSRK